MKQGRNPLGKGLAALLKENTPTENETTQNDSEFLIFSRISIDDIIPNPYQPRTDFNEKSLEELKNSIIEKGIIQPITVTRTENHKFQLISGERRLRAAKMANLGIIPAYIIEISSKEEMLELALIENIQRDTLNPIEIAIGFKRLIEECNLTQDEVAKKTAKDRTTITNFIRLLKLPEPIKNSLINHEITTGHARAILSLTEYSEQIALWEEIKRDKLNVRKVEKIVKSKKKRDKSKTMTIYNDPGIAEVVDKIRLKLGTKVDIRKKNVGGEIIIEYYSNSDLERLLEIFDAIK